MSLVPSETFMIKIFDKLCDVLRDLVPIVQFKKREKHPWRSVTFSKVADFHPAQMVSNFAMHRIFTDFQPSSIFVKNLHHISWTES